MFKNFTIVVLLLAFLCGFAQAQSSENQTILYGDLYKVAVNSHSDASLLIESGADAVVKLNDGYLVLTSPRALQVIEQSGLKYELVASGISSEQIALDNRQDELNLQKYNLLFQEDQLRVFRVEPGIHEDQVGAQLVRPKNLPLDIKFTAPLQIADKSKRAIEDLQTLINLVEQDSLQLYTERLQAFTHRLAGTDSNYASRDWISSKFAEFGYDSIVIDSFQAYVSGSYKDCQNVVAFKVGSVLPDHHVIVGAHFDGVSGSPAADDNGSGTAAVLEMARVLKDYGTDLTFVFILFDSEEQGLNGSYHYAENANNAGDSIVYMFNMDMIAHYENSDQAKLYHGTDLTYTDLFADLADSLLGITSHYQGNLAGSDHYPFTQYGYRATFLHEYVFSNVYHSYQDSTTYMNFEYMTDMTQAGLATVYYVSQSYALPQVAFSYIDPLPEQLVPDQTTEFQVEVTSVNGGTPVPGSGSLHYSINNGPYTEIAMTIISGNVYEAQLPALACGQRVSYYLSAEEVENGVFYDVDLDNPHNAMSATQMYDEIADNFQTDQGWTTENIGASSGFWQRGVPVNDPGWDYAPASDADGSGQCYLTENVYGNSDIDAGAVRLTSPSFDMSLPGTISYDYYLHLTNTDGGVDKLLVEISDNDGLSGWTQIAVHDTHGGRDWRSYQITELDVIAAGLTPSSNMKIRFTANDADPQSVVEAGIDNFRVTQALCEQQENITGVVVYMDTVTMALHEDSVLSFLEYEEGQNSGALDIWFHAEGGLLQPNPQYYNYSLTIGDDQVATVTDLGDYSLQIDGISAGQTTLTIELNWLDELIYTSPAFDVTINLPYVPGDANGNGDVDVSDAVYIINNIFAGGPAPDPFEAGDCNCDGLVNVSDAVWIVNFVFTGGNAPADLDDDGQPDC